MKFFFSILARMTFEIFLSSKCFTIRLSPKDVVSLAVFCLVCHQLFLLADWDVFLFLKRGSFRYLLVYFAIPSGTHDVFKAFRISSFLRYHGASIVDFTRNASILAIYPFTGVPGNCTP